MKPIIKIIAILACTAVLCQILFMGFYKGYVRFYIHTTQTLNELLNEKTYHDIVFLGSSRTVTGVYSQLIDSLNHTNTYNAGSDGGNLLEYKMLFDAYLVHHPAPKTVVINFDMHSFIGGSVFGNHVKYYHFLHNRVVDSVLNATGHHTYGLWLFPCLMVTELDDYTRGNAIKGMMGKGGMEIPPNSYHGKGFLSRGPAPIRLMVQDTLQATRIVNVSDTNINYLNAIIRTCEEKNIRLVFTYAPEYRELWQKRISNANEVMALITKIADQHHIPFHRYDLLGWCSDPQYFFDILHVNNQGAILYSTALAKDLE